MKMDLRKYLLKTKVPKQVVFDDVKDSPFDLFSTWMYQNHIEQNLGAAFTRNIDGYFETLEYGGWGYHWDDFLDSTGFHREGDMIELTLNKLNIEVISNHTVTFTPIDEDGLSKATDEDKDYLKRIGYITALGLDDELMSLYTKHFDEIEVEHNYFENILYISNYGWGYDYLYKIDKNERNKSIALIWSTVREAGYLEDDNYIYLVHSEDYEGYNAGFDIIEFFNELYRNNEITMNQEIVFQITYENYVDDTYNDHIKIFFDKLANIISETSEVIF